MTDAVIRLVDLDTPAVDVPRTPVVRGLVTIGVVKGEAVMTDGVVDLAVNVTVLGSEGTVVPDPFDMTVLWVLVV